MYTYYVRYAFIYPHPDGQHEWLGRNRYSPDFETMEQALAFQRTLVGRAPPSAVQLMAVVCLRDTGVVVR